MIQKYKSIKYKFIRLTTLKHLHEVIYDKNVVFYEDVTLYKIKDEILHSLESKYFQFNYNDNQTFDSFVL